MQIYNTLTRKVEPLVPKIPGKVGLYTCGPTVYDVSHAGHARVYCVFDVLVRVLRARGLAVKYVRNVTDVDDKILKRARENGETPLALSRRMTGLFHEDMAALGNLVPEVEPKVSDHIPQIVRFIEDLVAKEAAYVVDMPGGTRDVYFSVRGFPGYGKLSRRKLDELVAGARVEADEQNKRDPLDFALWKGTTPDQWGWDSPWGFGRPGWHIECSAMSREYLGHGFEIHGGGMDLIFPHHENEVAQSEAACPDHGPFAHIWMHNGFLNVDKEKMSKSLGNFVTIRDVLSRNDAEALRLFLLGVHYRGPLQFDTETLADGRVVFPGVDEAERRVDYFYKTLERLRVLLASGQTAPAKLPKELLTLREATEAAVSRADAALDDDLNTSVAIAELGEIAKLANEVCDLAQRKQKDTQFQGSAALLARTLIDSIGRIASELGVLQADARAYQERTRARRLALRKLDEKTIDAKVTERVEARKAKDFARADAVRAELAALGIELHDGPTGTSWSIGA
ncbi:MAG TPA: cysteine--tRNA ligase [Polyangiaceae bacterium]|nr:cysteine--tRNA ligase [Polyangiaceae bacterium]